MIHRQSGIEVLGVNVQADTRCEHYRSGRDIIAIRFKCCQVYYPCYECHVQVAGHLAQKWPATEFDRKAILCGGCGYELTISEYMRCGAVCPECRAEFNPNCELHYHLYFETAPDPN
jgi:uncharacterized CHY-type Zn-finger protein